MTEPQKVTTGNTYETKLKGHLVPSWADWLESLTFSHDINRTTTSSGEVIDQAALQGLIKKFLDLGFHLPSFNRLDLEDEEEI